ncbi:uncharacterized protein F4812DRAFT_438299 [Daldinia caldariorum]|uniref:uncharacterized protein n=1 Tax=Daldinia caldariorum TaxID=326644 RepID=UPI002008BB34|nr:uncharacterized protein F4812DRAFT_438299 [Daldinia caldariorum]KAI1465328.1 hypothetical protein F4812DRAFT_438299 [Daldinia caldariorum]
MVSYNKGASKSPYTIVVDDHSSRSSSTSSYNTMSSHTSLGVGSTSYPSSSSESSPVVYEQSRSPKADGFTIDIVRRSKVTVFNHHSSGYQHDSPTPGYGQHKESHGEKSHPHTGSR